MKKTTALILALTVAAAVFCGLWLSEKNDRSELETLAQFSAAEALRCFEDYAAGGSEGSYRDGTAKFRAFLHAWLALSEETPAEYTWFNSVYGFMILHPEQVQLYTEELLAAMRLLGADFTDPNAALRISELNNLLLHG